MVDVAYPAGSQHGDFRKYRVNFVFFQVQDICAETGNVGRTLPDQFTQMVLREDIDGKMMFENLYVVVPFHLAHQRPLDLMAGDILVVQDTVFAVAAFTGQFIASGAFFVELDSPRDQLLDHLRRTGHHLLDRRTVANPRTANQCVPDMFLERIGIVHHRGDPSLGVIRVALVHFAFGDDHHLAYFSRLERVTETGYPTADNQKIRFDVHYNISFLNSSALPENTLRSTLPGMPGIRCESVCCQSCHRRVGHSR